MNLGRRRVYSVALWIDHFASSWVEPHIILADAEVEDPLLIVAD